MQVDDNIGTVEYFMWHKRQEILFWYAPRAPHQVCHDMTHVTSRERRGHHRQITACPILTCLGHIVMGRPQGMPGEYFLSFKPLEILNSSHVIANLCPNPLFGINFPRSLKL